MKRIFLLGAIMFLLTGCTSIKSSNIDTIINDTLNTQVKTTNVYRKGYKYYLPKGLVLKSSDNYNEVFTNNKYMFYLYVDIVSYHNKTTFNYTENKGAYFSKSLNFNGKKGYLEINYYKNKQYLIEIMYNYAKIEVVGYEEDIREIVAYLMSILESITYNDNIINNYLKNDVEALQEENFNIFEVVGRDNYLEFTVDEDTSEGMKDPDYIN